MESGEHKSLASVLARIKGGLIVSCQASKGEPLAKPEHILALSLTVLNGGACALRLEGVENIRAVRARTDVPIVGITKTEGLSEEERLNKAYITASYDEAARVLEAGADIVALDATGRPREDGLSLAQTVARLHDEFDAAVWADTATFGEAEAAVASGVDMVSTTLYGYTRETYRQHGEGPDYSFLERCVNKLDVPVIMEGRVWHHDQASRAIACGAHAVVVGSAITRPHLITRGFVDALKSREEKFIG